jgi:hypothetical protein
VLLFVCEVLVLGVLGRCVIRYVFAWRASFSLMFGGELSLGCV